MLENKKISDDLLELKATVQNQQAELATLKEALAKATKERATTEKELAAAINKTEEQQDEIAELYELQDRFLKWKTLIAFDSPGLIAIESRCTPTWGHG